MSTAQKQLEAQLANSGRDAVQLALGAPSGAVAVRMAETLHQRLAA